jgi:hypothetical protein
MPMFPAAAFLCRYLQRHAQMLAVPCLFHALTGYYCPGCGGTRAVEALLHGQLLRAFAYHPLVGYAACVYILFLVSHTLEKLSSHRLRIGMKCRPLWLWLALVILAANVLVRDGALFFLGIDLLDRLI